MLGTGLLAGLVRLLGFATLLTAFPASTALMGFTGNPAAALNPSNIVGVIRTLGRSYATLLVACAALLLFTQLAPAVLGRGFLALLIRETRQSGVFSVCLR